MSFPTTPVLDTFSDTEGPPMTGWATPTGVSGLRSAAGVCQADAANAFGIWNSILSGADAEVYTTITTATGAGQTIGLFVRAKDIGSAATIDTYGLTILEAGTDAWTLQIYTNGVPSSIGASFDQEVADGDIVGLRIIGNVLYAFLNGVEIASRTDDSNTYPLAGYIGAAISDTTGRIDNFGGGNIISGSRTTGGLVPGHASYNDRPGKWN